MPELEELSREELITIIRELRQQIAALQKQIQEPHAPLPGTKPPAFVKANRAPKQDKARKKRTQQFVRPREKPTQVRYHACARCPDCGQLHGYLWTFSTPLLRYFVCDKSRGSRVAHAVLGEAFGGAGQ